MIDESESTSNGSTSSGSSEQSRDATPLMPDDHFVVPGPGNIVATTSSRSRHTNVTEAIPVPPTSVPSSSSSSRMAGHKRAIDRISQSITDG